MGLVFTVNDFIKQIPFGSVVQFQRGYENLKDVYKEKEWSQLKQ